MKRNASFVILSGLLASTQAFATLTPTIERGDKNIYHTSPRGVQEVCVIPKKYPGADYKKSDLKKEIELCNTNFYEVAPADANNGTTGAALCAKENSTNPGVNVYELDLSKNQTKSVVEANGCADASKLAKYKNSISCSATPAIIGYYHLSRILGRIGRVPVSVLRSMDIETHKKLGRDVMAKLQKQGKTADLIYQTWGGLMSNLNAGLASSKKDQLMTDDGQQSYGGLVVNPKHEEFYSDLFTKGTDRAAAFGASNPTFQLVKNPNSLDKLFSSAWNPNNIQKMMAMKDETEFILMDHIMDQQDRFGNIAEVTRFAYLAKENAQDQKYELQMDDSLEDYKKAKAAGLTAPNEPIQVKSMVLKDNDCGVTKTNVVKNAHLLSQIRHMDPKTYKKLLEFQTSVGANKAFFTSGLMFTSTDYAEMVANVNDAATILKGLCKSGQLKLDLDVDHYIETGSLKQGSCELQ